MRKLTESLFRGAGAYALLAFVSATAWSQTTCDLIMDLAVLAAPGEYVEHKTDISDSDCTIQVEAKVDKVSPDKTEIEFKIDRSCSSSGQAQLTGKVEISGDPISTSCDIDYDNPADSTDVGGDTLLSDVPELQQLIQDAADATAEQFPVGYPIADQLGDILEDSLPPEPVSYVYTGNAFESIDSAVPSGVDSVTVTITLATKLAPNLNGATVTPLSWEISDGFNSADSETWAGGTYFSFSTDAFGQIIGWAHQLQRAPEETPEGEFQFLLTVYQSPDIFVNRDIVAYCVSPSNCSGRFAIVSDNPGQWSPRPSITGGDWGDPFTIVDPFGRMMPGDFVVVYVPGQNPLLNGYLASDVSVSNDGNTLTGTIPPLPSDAIGAQVDYLFRVTNDYVTPRFSDLPYKLSHSGCPPGTVGIPPDCI